MNRRSLVLLAVLVVPSFAVANPYSPPASLQARVFDGVGLSSGTQVAPTSEAVKVEAFQLDPVKVETNIPLDDGGGVSSDTRRLLSLILGFFPGFGIGHFIARDQNGFVLFLVIDLAIAVVGGTLAWALNVPGFLWGLGVLVVVVERVIEALDAYAAAGGERLIEVTRERSISFASVSPSAGPVPVTTRLFDLRF